MGPIGWGLRQRRQPFRWNAASVFVLDPLARLVASWSSFSI
jgi:hypothetical protein